MRCPRCNAADTKVVDSREVRDGVRRRRECTGCGFRFTTRERFDFAPLLVVKRNGRVESFDRSKIVAAVKLVTGKRPVSLAAIEALAFEVERSFMTVGNEVRIPSWEIARAVRRELERLDPVAARRFGASYQEGEGGRLEKLDALPARTPARQLALFDEGQAPRQKEGSKPLP